MIIWPRRSPICSSTAPSGGAPRHRQNDGDPAQVYDGLTHEFGTTWCDRTTRRWRRSKWICCAASQPLRSEPLSWRVIEIGSASGRERGCPSVSDSVVGGALKKKQRLGII